MTSGRVLPHDLDAEQAVLGCLLIDAEAILAIRDILDPADFYAERHGHVFRAAHDTREERVGDVRNDHAENLGAIQAQSLREGARLESEGTDRF